MAKRKKQTRKQWIATQKKSKNKKIVATQARDRANNNLEPTPPSRSEDREIPMQTLEENVKQLETKKSFDPKSLVADILKKHGA